MEKYAYVIEVYDGHRYTHLVHRLAFDLTDDGWWGAKLLCSGVLVEGGKLPIKTNNFAEGLVVTCLACLVLE